MSPSSSRRFRDPRSSKYDFLESVLVCCPGCEKVAHVGTAPNVAGMHSLGLLTPRRLVCGNCGLTKEWSHGYVALHRSRYEPATDPHFSVRLWLQTETRHGWIWAYNPEHLDLIRRFVQAPLREGVPGQDHGRKMTVVARLPAWMQQAKNRDEVLRAIARIHASLLT